MPGYAELLQGADSPAVAFITLSSPLLCGSLRLYLKHQSSSTSSACRFRGTGCVKALPKPPQHYHRMSSNRDCQWYMHHLQPLPPLHLHFPWAHA